jgi:hypothetical protein
MDGHNSRVLDTIRSMPAGIKLFLVYASLLLAGIGLSLPFVVELAATMPISGQGVVVMALLAYTVFTMTLVLQRKQAGRGFALGLASLTLPLVAVLLLGGRLVEGAIVAAIAAALFWGLTRPDVRAYLSEA